MDELPIAHEVGRVLDEEGVDAAKRLHDKRVHEEFERAQAGETINLSDLMASKEEILARSVRRDA